MTVQLREKLLSKTPEKGLQSIHDALNRPIQDLRISVIDQCNFRCTYCMPEKDYVKYYTFLEKEAWLTFPEIERLARIFVKFGVRKIRLTGGEPLLRPNLSELVERLRSIPDVEDLALTTNGYLLAQQAQSLKNAGLNRITVSLDTIDPKLFRHMNGGKGQVESVLDGIHAAERAGFGGIKINTVVQKGVNDNQILELVEYFRKTPHILRFIEYMDVGNCNHWRSEYVVPSADLLTLINRRYPIAPIDSNYYGEVASRYRFKDTGSEIGFISSVTQPFCGSCTRARLSTDGKVYTCLFSGKGTDFKNLLHKSGNDQNIETLIRNTWKSRKDRYSELRPQPHLKTNKVEMFQIGG